ncbi:MAG TPA: A24 family peptidase [Candidatus Limnocylindria bacterium]
MVNAFGSAAWQTWALIAYIVFLVGVAAYDIRFRRVPNAAVYPAIAVAAVAATMRPGDGPWWSYWLAGLAAAGLLLALGAASRGGMGVGDAKLAAVIGLVAGWPGVVVALFVAFAAGAISGLTLVAAGADRRTAIPFAPALGVGAIMAVVAGRQLASILMPWLG